MPQLFCFFSAFAWVLFYTFIGRRLCDVYLPRVIHLAGVASQSIDYTYDGHAFEGFIAFPKPSDGAPTRAGPLPGALVGYATYCDSTA